MYMCGHGSIKIGYVHVHGRELQSLAQALTPKNGVSAWPCPSRDVLTMPQFRYELSTVVSPTQRSKIPAVPSKTFGEEVCMLGDNQCNTFLNLGHAAKKKVWGCVWVLLGKGVVCLGVRVCGA